MLEPHSEAGGMFPVPFSPASSGLYKSPTQSQVVPDQDAMQEQMRALANILIDQFLATRKNGQRETQESKAKVILQ